jgi:hypothetical protein
LKGKFTCAAAADSRNRFEKSLKIEKVG